MDKEQLKKDYDEFAKFLEDFILTMNKKNKMSDGKNPLWFMSVPYKKNTLNDDSCPRTFLFQEVQKEYRNFISRHYRTNEHYSKLIDDKTFKEFFDDFSTSFVDLIADFAKKKIDKFESEKPSIKLSPLRNRDEAIFALLSGSLVVDETMKKDGKNFYQYKNGIFYRMEEGKNPVVTDIGKITSKNFAVIQNN